MSTLFDATVAPGPHPSLGKHAETYGRVIGSWNGEYEDLNDDGSPESGSLEVHFAWVLQGLAVQDVWIAPARAQRATHAPAKRDTYGTTLRVFDPAAEVWRVVWLNPARNARVDLIGRRIGDDIIQLGTYKDAPVKWTFTHITPRSFTWQGLVLEADGVTWRRQTEFKLRRTA
jgi:hypothetical protein